MIVDVLGWAHWDREFSICTTHDFCDIKTSNFTSSPQSLSGPLLVVELGGPRDDKFDASEHE